MTIKKPDGTFARVPLSEFKKMQAAKKQGQTDQTAPASVSVKNSVPAPLATSAASNQSAEQIMSRSTIEIKNDQVKNNNRPLQITREDARSPLEEKMPLTPRAPLTSSARDKQVEQIVRGLGFSVASDLQGRLKSLVLARLKDIKTEDEVKETLLRAVKNGGLGLTQPQANKLAQSCQEMLRTEINTSKEQVPEPPVLKGKTAGMTLMVEPPELPMVIPVNNTVQIKNTTPVATVKQNSAHNVVSKIITEGIANEPVFKISSKPAVRPTMQDIAAPEVEMGPVEEFRSITLVEFRRLSGNPEEAAQRLQQKMLTVKEESYIWYLDAIAAFHHSPLYMEYITAAGQSLAERKTLANVLSLRNSIKLTEVMAIIEMEKSL